MTNTGSRLTTPSPSAQRLLSTVLRWNERVAHGLRVGVGHVAGRAAPAELLSAGEDHAWVARARARELDAVIYVVPGRSVARCTFEHLRAVVGAGLGVTAGAPMQRGRGSNVTALTNLLTNMDSEVGRLDEALVEQQQMAEEIDARALPIIGWGLLLTTLWPWLAVTPACGGAHLLRRVHVVRCRPPLDFGQAQAASGGRHVMP